MKQEGFTFIEIILVLSVIAILAVAAVPVFQSLQTRNELDTTSMVIAHSWRRAQALAQSSVKDSPWGVHIQGGTVTLFRGLDYASRDVNDDEIFSVSTTISFGGLTDVTFSKLSGDPLSIGTVTLSATDINESRQVSINQKGAVTF
ncbi:MAG TPA: type II secretion system protein [Candidatus Paceibacterota bacterium]